MTVDESKTHFSLWAAMKAPLILGNNLSDMPDDLYDVVTNKHVIDVNVRMVYIFTFLILLS